MRTSTFKKLKTKVVYQYSVESLFIVIAPIVGFFALHIRLLTQDAAIDPWIYTGYGQEFRLLQQLYDWRYYAVRFPVVLLNFAVPKGLDPIVGFAIVRYLVFISCGVPFYLWARYHFGIVHAIAAYLFLFCNPLLPRVLQWDLTPFVSVPMALVGITLWLLPTESNAINRMLANRVLAGFAFAASAAAHAFTGTAIAAFFLVEAARRLIKREYFGLVLFDILAPIAGAAVCFAIGMALYFVILGPFDPSVIFSVTFDAVREGDQYAVSNSEEVSKWIWRDSNALIPLLLLGFIAIGFTRDLLKDNIVSRLWWFGLLYYAAYGAYEFFFHQFVLEPNSFWYFFHLTLVIYLLFPVCLYLITQQLTPRHQTIVGVVAIAVLILTPAYQEQFQIDPNVLKDIVLSFKVLSVITVILLLVAIYSIRAFARVTGVMSAYAIGLTLAIQLLTLCAPAFSLAYSNVDEAREYDVYRAAVKTVRVFARYARPSQRVKVWYPAKENSVMSIASTVLLDSINDYGGGMPDLGDYERLQLRSPALNYIMMLSEDFELIANGKSALVRNGYEFRDVVHQTIGGPHFKAELDLIELTDVAGTKAMAQARPLSIDTMTRASEAAQLLKASASGVAFRSAPKPWAYIGRMPLLAECTEGGGWVAADVRVTHGTVGIGVLNRNDNDFLAITSVATSNDIQTILLRIDSFTEAGDLILQNWDGSFSEGLVHSVRIAAEGGQTPQPCGLADR